MKKILCVAALLFPLAAFAANPRSISVTIQDNGHAQISETHDVPPPGPDGLLRIAPLPETLLPATVHPVPVERGETLEILSQRFFHDLRNDTALFRAYRNDTVVLRQGTDSFAGQLVSLPDFSSPAPSILLATENEPIHFVPDLMKLDFIEFPPRPHLARTPTLAWQTPTAQIPPPAVQLHYAVSNLSWSASHEAILAENSRSIALSTRAQIQNRTGRDFPNARIRLALTDKGQFAPLVPNASDPRAATPPALRYSADGQSWIPERSAAASAVVSAYDLPRPLSLPADADVRAELSSSASLPVETRYVYDGVRFDRYQRNRRTDANLGVESSPVVETRLVLKNGKSAALPPGEFRLLRGPADGALEWIGSDWLPPLGPGESVTLNLGPAAGLSGRRIRTAFAEVVPLKTAEESFEISLENQTGADQTILVVEHLYRGENHEIAAASTEHAPGPDPHSIQFEVPVKAGSVQSFTYTVRYSW